MVLGIAGWFPLHPPLLPRGGRNRGRRSSRPPQRSYGVYTTQPETNSRLRPRRDESSKGARYVRGYMCYPKIEPVTEYYCFVTRDC